MPIRNFQELIDKVKGGRKRTVALVEAHDEHALQAVIHAGDIVNAILVGSKEKIAPVLTSLGKNPADYEIVEPEGDTHPSVCAAGLIHAGRADFLMKGKLMTGDMLKGVLKPESGLRKGGLMSHIQLTEMPKYPKLLAVTDGGMVTYPDLEQKKQIVENAVGFFHSLGYIRPHVAALCAIEKVNPKMPETVDAAALKELSEKGVFGDCYIEGPISYDLAMVPQLSPVKGYSSPVTGDFDILLVPEITAGNILGKCLVYTAGGRMAGLVLGCKVPIVLTSRGSSADEKYFSLALGAGCV
ncbi:MAG: phosphate butyryltransferase [Clostridiales bacterium]|jgi:phosphate butyryltransferase|nr:phosphate butyryltransferase [Clostridiales bacterium]